MSDRDQRTEKPTPKRRREARRDGRLARSPELAAWVGLLVSTYLIGHTFSAGEKLSLQLMTKVGDVASHPTDDAAVALLGTGLRGVIGVVAPLLVALPLLGVVADVAQTGGIALTAKRLRPDFSLIDPRKGVKRLVSPQSGWQVAKQLLKVSVLGLVVYSSVRSAVPLLTGQGPTGVGAVCAVAAGRALSVVRSVAAAGVVVAGIDYGIARRRVTGQLRMTREEVKEEQKSSDGNPLVKGAIRRKQRALARMRMIAAIASADAVVVNPTHVAVAIRYTPGTGAPRVVAKGLDELALRIKAEANAQRVPIVQDIPLARALHASVPLDAEIPPDLYEAVAKLLSFVYGLRRSGRVVRLDGEGHRPPTPLLAATSPTAA